VTSGSTTDPRAACFTEEALVHGIEHLRRGMELTARDVVLISIPLSHSYGFDNGVLSLAAVGTPLVLQPDVLPAALQRTIRERAVTFFPAVPALIRALGHAGPGGATSLRSVICASAPLAREDAERFAASWGLRVRQFLGATEAGGIAFETRPEDPASAGTVGFPLPGVRVEPHEGGLRVHSKALRHALLPGGEAAEGPVETGDLAELTPEGRLRLLGRATLVANVGGHKVDLGALDAFFRGLPGVAEAAAVPVEDAARGHRIVAWIESRDQSPERLLELCRTRLSAREVPHEIRVVAELPRTGRGKLDRAALSLQAKGSP
jgi:acyl-CoA synthetase (AMP-forming)/AMP-acid ligase II